MPWPMPVSLLLAIVVAARVARLAARAWLAALGALLAVVAVVLYRVTPTGTIDLSIGIVLVSAAGWWPPRW